MGEAGCLPEGIIGQRWIHVFEEDTAEGAVYRPGTSDIPLSRRPRVAFELMSDGSARIYLPGPDDRPAGAPASWRHTAEGIVVTRDDGARSLTIVDSSPERLIVRDPNKGH